MGTYGKKGFYILLKQIYFTLKVLFFTLFYSLSKTCESLGLAHFNYFKIGGILMKKLTSLILSGSIIGLLAQTAFAGGGGGAPIKNDDGSEYSLDCYSAAYINDKIGTNYSDKDNVAYWGFTDMSEYSEYGDYSDYAPSAYKQVDFPNVEDHDYYDENYSFSIVAIDNWNDLPLLTIVNIENDIRYISNSFNNCPQLQCIFIPKSVEKIVNSFNQSSCTIYGVPGSYAESYAKQAGLNFVNGVQVVIDDWGIVFDQPALIKDDRTMVPMRKIFEKLGASVDWDENTQTVTAKKGSKSISLTIGSDTLTINGSATKLDVSPFIENGRTLVPVRAVSESLGASVNWDGNTQTVTIN